MSDAPTPSQQIVADANATVSVTDARGRTLEIRRMRGGQLARFMRICGFATDIQTYFGEAVVRASVVSIDGVPVPTPKTSDDVDMLWDRVDTDATEAAVKHFAKLAEAKDGPLASAKPGG